MENILQSCLKVNQAQMMPRVVLDETETCQMKCIALCISVLLLIFLKLKKHKGLKKDKKWVWDVLSVSYGSNLIITAPSGLL